MKTLLFTLLLIFLSNDVFPQSPTLYMDKTFGGNQTDYFFTVRANQDGTYILAGTSSSSGLGEGDFYIKKIDCDGNVIWSQNFGDTRNERHQWAMNDGFQVIEDVNTPGEDYIMVGTRNHTDPQAIGGTDLDFYIVKFEEGVGIDWHSTWGDENDDDHGRIVKQTSDGGFIVVGLTFGYDVWFNDVYAKKFDIQGNTEWERTYNLNTWEDAYDLFEIDDNAGGGYMIIGSTYGNGRTGPYIFKIDDNGNALTSFGDYSFIVPSSGSSIDGGQGKFRLLTDGSNPITSGVAYDIQATSDGGYLVCGRDDSNFSDPGGFFVKLDGSFSIMWISKFQFPEHNYLYSVKEIPGGGYIAVGETRDPGVTNGMFDYWIVRTDAAGNIIWTETYGGTENDWATGVDINPDGAFAITGLFRNNLNNSADARFLLISEDPNYDMDGDGLVNSCDNCPSNYNPGQEDCNIDDEGDACTNWTVYLDCPPDLTLTIPAGQTTILACWDDATGATDCCNPKQDGNLMIGQGQGPTNKIDQVGPGDYTIGYWLTDGCLTNLTCTFNLTVVQASNITVDFCEDDFEVITPSGLSEAFVSWMEPIANSTCGGVNINPLTSWPNNSMYFISQYCIGYEITDNCGGLETCEFCFEVKPFGSCRAENENINLLSTKMKSKESGFEKLEIFPNPAQDFLFLNPKFLEVENAQVNIYDNLGRLILQRNITCKNEQTISFDISALNNGLYHFVIEGQRERLSTHTFVVNR